VYNESDGAEAAGLQVSFEVFGSEFSYDLQPVSIYAEDHVTVFYGGKDDEILHSTSDVTPKTYASRPEVC
jgi:hypothetical protein